MDKVGSVIGPNMFVNWFNKHNEMGGYVASSYVDWNILHSPQRDFIKLIEAYRKIPLENVMSFQESNVTDNHMPYRNILEDGSKIYYLTQEVESNTLQFHPQIIHEPWYNRYRVHPGSGRLVALWLCNINHIKTIYTHFNEPMFCPPGKSFKIDSYNKFKQEIGINASNIDFQIYEAFPKDNYNIDKTTELDSEWHFQHVQTDKHWHFIRYSEGRNFLAYKNEWRTYATDFWYELQYRSTQIGRTVFNFRNDKVVDCMRGGICLKI